MPTPNIPIVNEGLLYVNGLQVAQGTVNLNGNTATGTITIQPGQCRDSTDTNDINLPQLFNTANPPVAIPYTLNPFVNGVNGLDTGALNAVAVTLYAVYAIADSTEYKPSGTLLSLSFTNPQLPLGYDMFRRIGTVLSNGAAAPNTGILSFHQRGNGSVRDTYWNVPIATPLNAGHGAVLTAFNWTDATPRNIVPLNAQKVFATIALTADGGGTRTVVFSADASVAAGAEVTMSAAAGVVNTLTLPLPASPSAGPVLPLQTFYNLSNALATIAVSCSGFVDLL